MADAAVGVAMASRLLRNNCRESIREVARFPDEGVRIVEARDAASGLTEEPKTLLIDLCDARELVLDEVFDVADALVIVRPCLAHILADLTLAVPDTSAAYRIEHDSGKAFLPEVACVVALQHFAGHNVA